MFTKLVSKLKDRMLDPFAFAHPMPPGSVIVCGVESGDQLAHTDASSAPQHPPPVLQVKVRLPPLHFWGRLPQYRLRI